MNVTNIAFDVILCIILNLSNEFLSLFIIILEVKYKSKEPFMSNKSADSQSQVTLTLNRIPHISAVRMPVCVCVSSVSQTASHHDFIFTYSQSRFCVSMLYYFMKSGQKMDLV